jgi:hypothetical protein
MHGLYLLWFVQEQQLSPAIVAAVLAAADLALIALEIPTGWLADRFGYRTSLVVGSAVQVAGMLWCSLGGGVAGLIVATLLIAAGDAFRSGADEALLYRSCAAVGREADFQRIDARTRAVERGALVALVLTGGAIVHRWGFVTGWIAETALCGVGLVIALLMTEPPRATERRRDHHQSSTRHRMALGAMTALVLPAALLSTAASVTSFLTQTTGTAGAAGMSVMVAAITLAEAMGAAVAVRMPAAATATQWKLAAVGLLAVIASSGAPWALEVAALALACLDGVAHPLRAAAIQRAAAEGWRATAASAASACDLLISTAALPLAGIWRSRRR